MIKTAPDARARKNNRERKGKEGKKLFHLSVMIHLILHTLQSVPSFLVERKRMKSLRIVCSVKRIAAMYITVVFLSPLSTIDHAVVTPSIGDTSDINDPIQPVAI